MSVGRTRRLGPRPVALLFALVGVMSPPAEAGRVGFEARTSKVPGQIVALEPGDLDGDGTQDLLVVYRRGSGTSARRFVGVFFGRATGFERGPDVAFSVPTEAAVFDVGDVDGQPGDEAVYLTESGVWAHGFRGRKAEPPRRILGLLSLVGDPEEGDLPAWDFVRTLTATAAGSVVMVPGRRELRLFREQDGALVEFCEVDISRRSYYSTGGPGGGRSSGPGSGFSFQATTSIPHLSFVEATGDARVDLVTHRDDLFELHPGTADGCFSRSAVRRQQLRVRSAEEQRRGEASVSARVKDLDGDGIADVALTKVSGGLTNLRTEIRLHRGRAGGGFEARPVQVFQASGFGAFARFQDIDGDGRMEMVQPRAEVSIIGMTRVLLSSSFTVDVLIRRSSDRPGQVFTENPVQTLRTTFGLDFGSASGLLGSAPLFGHDFDGDGRLDLMLSKGKSEMGLHRGRTGPKPFEDRDRFGLEGPGSIATRVLTPGLGRRPEVLIWYPGRKGLDDTFYTYRPNL